VDQVGWAEGKYVGWGCRSPKSKGDFVDCPCHLKLLRAFAAIAKMAELIEMPFWE